MQKRALSAARAARSRRRQVRELAKTINVRSGDIRKEIVTKAQPTPAQPRVVFEVRSKGIPLAAFIGTRQTKKGVTVQVLKGSPRKTLRAAFGVDKFGGNFFGRAGKGSKRYASPHVGRLPIAKLFGPTILSQYIKDEIQKVGADTWAERLPIELARESTFALKQAGLV